MASHTSRPAAAPTRVPRRMEHLDLRFTDHAGNPASMAFRSIGGGRLPPLYAFPIYLTHPEASLDSINLKELVESVVDDDTYSVYTDTRLDVYVLPGGDEEGCINHYRREKAARGEYTRQIEALNDSSEGEPRIPGFVPNYYGGGGDEYNQVLLMCKDKTWEHEQRWLFRVNFDPISQELYDSWRGESEEPTLPPFKVHKMPAGKQADWQDGKQQVASWMYSVSRGHIEWYTIGPWEKAREKGWENWRA